MSSGQGRGRGRPPGAKNKRTAEREQQLVEVAEKIGDALGSAFAGDAHALLMAIYKDETKELNYRLDAAKAAIRYEKPALSTVDARVEADVKAVHRIERLIVRPSDPNG